MSTTGRPFESRDWMRVEELFHGALERPESERTAWLNAQNSTGPIRSEVDSLLYSWRRSQNLEADGADGQPDCQPGPITGVLPAERFGPYQAERLIGRGGMGAVYLARRADGQFEHAVAVKVIATHLGGDEFVARFHTERQLLASLNHPHITRLLDGGVLAGGDPYLVMEYVEGEPLDGYCDSRKLTVEVRLRLFLQVCEAVEYAHRNLIVHRDLKPGNILVTADGQVKLLDFGTAALAAPSSAVTPTRSRMVTPRYASPERLRGERANTANDVFSLGVILYELLTGAWPYGDPDSMIGELKRAMGDAVPSAPAAVVTAEAAELRGLPLVRLQHAVEGDLSSIVLKALDSDPARRFGSVQQLSEDVERFLERRPIQARPQTTWYRTEKFLRRHWVPVAAAALVVLAVVVAAIVSFRQTAVAREEARRSDAVSAFLGEMLSSAAPQTFDPDKFTVTQLLDQAAARLEGRFPDDPRTEAMVRENLAKSYAATFQYEKSKTQLTRVLAIYRLLGDESGIMRALKTTADYESNAGHKDTSVALYRETLVHLNRLNAKDYPETIAYVKRSLAQDLQWLNRDLEEVKRLNDEVIALGRSNPDVSRIEVANALTMKGDLSQAGSAERERLYRQALEVGRQEAPGGLWEGNPLIGLASLYAGREDFKAAREFAQRRYELFLKYHGSRRATTAAAEILWARYRAAAGEVQEGLALVQEAVPIAKKGFPSDSLRLWSALRDAAIVCNLARRFAEAEVYAREASAIADRAKLPPVDARRANALWIAGVALDGQHRYRDAIRSLEQAEVIYQKIGGAGTGLPGVRKALQDVRGHQASIGGR